MLYFSSIFFYSYSSEFCIFYANIFSFIFLCYWWPYIITLFQINLFSFLCLVCHVSCFRYIFSFLCLVCHVSCFRYIFSFLCLVCHVSCFRYNLGAYYFGTNYFAKAKFQLTESYKIHEMFLGEDHPDTIYVKKALETVTKMTSDS